MLDTILVIGSIIFIGVLTYAFQLRNRKYKNYPTHCDVLYYSKKEKIKMIDPNEYKSSSYNFETRRNRELELEDMDISDIIIQAREDEYSGDIPTNLSDQEIKSKLIKIIMDIESGSFKDDIGKLPKNYTSDTIFDNIY